MQAAAVAVGESNLERKIAVREALTDVAALPQMQRQAIFLTAVDGQSHDEVASALGISEGALRGLLYRARATLRSAAAALTPAPLLKWASGGSGTAGPTAERLAELTAAGSRRRDGPRAEGRRRGGHGRRRGERGRRRGSSPPCRPSARSRVPSTRRELRLRRRIDGRGSALDELVRTSHPNRRGREVRRACREEGRTRGSWQGGAARRPRLHRAGPRHLHVGSGASLSGAARIRRERRQTPTWWRS